jgi:hypothetical protein
MARSHEARMSACVVRPGVVWRTVGSLMRDPLRNFCSWHVRRSPQRWAAPWGLAVLYLMTIGGASAEEGAATDQKSAAPCSAAEFHQWDFWLGSWRVTDLKGVFQGTNEIKVAPSGCGLIENWHGAQGGTGVSFNGYDPVRRMWTQFWVSDGEVIRLEGRRAPHGALRLRGSISNSVNGTEHPFRGTWTPQTDGSVKQEFFEYDPKAKTWNEWFTGIYRRPDEPDQRLTCTAQESRQFDFWVGKWEVFDRKTGEHAGSSLIEKLYGGCAIRENWTQTGFTGGSLSAFSTVDNQWHQTWVDQSGALREFVGSVVAGDMVLVARVPSKGLPGPTVLLRMKFTHNPDHTVRQHSESSQDDGQTWQERYDYVYRTAVAP